MFIKDLEEQRKEIENRNVNVVNEEVFDLNRLIDKYAGLSLLSTSSMLKSTLFDKISGKNFFTHCFPSPVGQNIRFHNLYLSKNSNFQ